MPLEAKRFRQRAITITEVPLPFTGSEAKLQPAAYLLMARHNSCAMAAFPTARLVQEQLAVAGIQLNGTPVWALGDMLLGRTLRAVLALPDRGFAVWMCWAC